MLNKMAVKLKLDIWVETLRLFMCVPWVFVDQNSELVNSLNWNEALILASDQRVA